MEERDVAHLTQIRCPHMACHHQCCAPYAQIRRGSRRLGLLCGGEARHAIPLQPPSWRNKGGGGAVVGRERERVEGDASCGGVRRGADYEASWGEARGERERESEVRNSKSLLYMEIVVGWCGLTG